MQQWSLGLFTLNTMAKPGDTGFTSSTGPAKVVSKTDVDYKVNEKGQAVEKGDLAAMTLGVRRTLLRTKQDSF